MTRALALLVALVCATSWAEPPADAPVAPRIIAYPDGGACLNAPAVLSQARAHRVCLAELEAAQAPSVAPLVVASAAGLIVGAVVGVLVAPLVARAIGP